MARPHAPACCCVVCGAPPVRTSRRAVLAGAAIALGMAGAARAATPPDPDGAIARLLAGNARFAAHNLTACDADLALLRQNAVAGQEPFAAILSCADSRVPVELVFDASLGQLFVVRVAGNVCSPEVIASLEYAAVVLNVAAILVLGHAGCGAVKAAMAAQPAPGQISALYAPLRPAVARAGGDLAAAIRANASIQADLLRTASPAIAGAIAEGKLRVAAAYYDIGSGTAALLD